MSKERDIENLKHKIADLEIMIAKYREFNISEKKIENIANIIVR